MNYFVGCLWVRLMNYYEFYYNLSLNYMSVVLKVEPKGCHIFYLSLERIVGRNLGVERIHIHVEDRVDNLWKFIDAF